MTQETMVRRHQELRNKVLRNYDPDASACTQLGHLRLLLKKLLIFTNELEDIAHRVTLAEYLDTIEAILDFTLSKLRIGEKGGEKMTIGEAFYHGYVTGQQGHEPDFSALEPELQISAQEGYACARQDIRLEAVEWEYRVQNDVDNMLDV